MVADLLGRLAEGLPHHGGLAAEILEHAVEPAAPLPDVFLNRGRLLVGAGDDVVGGLFGLEHHLADLQAGFLVGSARFELLHLLFEGTVIFLQDAALDRKLGIEGAEGFELLLKLLEPAPLLLVYALRLLKGRTACIERGGQLLLILFQRVGTVGSRSQFLLGLFARGSFLLEFLRIFGVHLLKAAEDVLPVKTAEERFLKAGSVFHLYVSFSCVKCVGCVLSQYTTFRPPLARGKRILWRKGLKFVKNAAARGATAA